MPHSVNVYYITVTSRVLSIVIDGNRTTPMYVDYY